MASKVIAKLPVAPFAQVNSKAKPAQVNGADIVTVAMPPRAVEAPKSGETCRIAQLEQNIKFLQEQHQLMLAGLHQEIESLKNRNKELQFQLVFVKGNVPSTPSSPEDDTRYKTYQSPKNFNITPLQVELLEKEMSDLKLQLQEAESRNVYLSAIVDEQKKKLDRYERDREKERERAGQPDPELLRKLDDAEAIIRRLRRENSDLRRESAGAAHFQQLAATNGHAAAAVAAAPPNDRPHQPNGQYQHNQHRSNGQSQGRGNHRHNNRGHGNHFRDNWFPPLHSQSFWQQGNNKSTGIPQQDNTLPHLRQGQDSSQGPHHQQQQQQQQQQYHHQSRRGHNNNHYHNGDGRKYRQNKGGKPS